MVYFLLDGPKNPQNDKNLLENSNFYTIIYPQKNYHERRDPFVAAK